MWTDRRPAACQARICSTAPALDLLESGVGFRVLGFGVWSVKILVLGVGLGFWVWGFEFKFSVFGVGVWGSGFGVGV